MLERTAYAVPIGNHICRSLNPPRGLKAEFYMSGCKLPLEPVLEEFRAGFWYLRRTDLDGDSCLHVVKNHCYTYETYRFAIFHRLLRTTNTSRAHNVSVNRSRGQTLNTETAAFRPRVIYTSSTVDNLPASTQPPP
jgi:hypothetical protein